MLGLTWIVSVAVSSPIVLGANYTERRNQHPGICTFYNSDFLIYSSMASFYVPCIAMIVLYWRVFRAIRRRERKTAVQTSTAAPLLDCSAQPTTTMAHDNGGPHRRTCDDSTQSNTMAQLHPSPLNLPPPPPPSMLPSQSLHCPAAEDVIGGGSCCTSRLGDSVARPEVRRCSAVVDGKYDDTVQRNEGPTHVANAEYSHLLLARDGIGTATATSQAATVRLQPLPILLVPSCESHVTYNGTDGVLEMLPTPFLPSASQVCSSEEIP
jgi:7 transmembrane receptor (rhodopsin family)